MNITNDKITEIFYLADDFCKEFHAFLDKQSLTDNTIKKVVRKKPILSHSEIITIMIMFHYGAFRNFKHFYLFYVQKHLQSYFPKTVSYNRFVELMQKEALTLTLLIQMCCLGESTGISYVDSTPIRVCKNKRIKSNKVFKGLAEVGKSTMGWFYGFKLHLIINDKGEILNFVITPGNTDDREPLKNKNFIKKIRDKLYGDKGYISRKLTELLFVDGIHLITGIRNNMKNTLMELKDRILLRKRSVIETVNDELKNICQIEHSRHRSFTNFITNLLAGIAAYCFFPKKPAIHYDVENSNQLVLF
jgi:hypothetical protein